MIIITPTTIGPNSGCDSTSGTAFYNPWKNVIERRALRMVGAYAADGEPTSRQIKDCDDVLNMMLKEWTAQGLLWTKVWGTLFLNQGQGQYRMAGGTYNGFSPCAWSRDPGNTSYIQTSLEEKMLKGASVCLVPKTVSIGAGDYIGIINNDGKIEWFFGKMQETDVEYTVIALFSDAAMTNVSTITRDASAANLVYSFPTLNQAGRPARITSAVRQLYDPITTNGVQVSLQPDGGISRTDYERLPNKTVQGKVINYYYDPQLVYGVLNVWPTPDDPRDKLILSMERSIEDVLNDTDAFDAPQEAMGAIAYSLAVELEPEYPLAGSDFQKLMTMAATKKKALLDYNRGTGPLQFQLDWH